MQAKLITIDAKVVCIITFFIFGTHTHPFIVGSQNKIVNNLGKLLLKYRSYCSIFCIVIEFCRNEYLNHIYD